MEMQVTDMQPASNTSLADELLLLMDLKCLAKEKPVNMVERVEKELRRRLIRTCGGSEGVFSVRRVFCPLQPTDPLQLTNGWLAKQTMVQRNPYS